MSMTEDQNKSPQPEVEDTVALIKRKREEDRLYHEWKEKMFIRQKSLELAIQANSHTETSSDVVQRALKYFNWLNTGDHSA
jgi:hypothetical protein